MNSYNSILKKMLWKLRSVCLSMFGREVILSSKFMQNWLAYKVTDGRILDQLSIVPIKYDLYSVIGKRIFLDGAFEEEEIRFFEGMLDRLNHKVTIIDVGANIGVHSIRLAAGRSNVEVYAFEPSGGTADMLRNNIELNKLASRIHVVRNAVSDCLGQATFYECEDNAFSSLKDTHRKKVINTSVVPVTTIDKFVEENGISNLALIKVDVEGFETEVIRGAVSTLERISPDLFVEIYGGVCSNPDPEGTVKLITSLGYKAYVFSGGEISQYDKHNDGKYNYFFTKRPVNGITTSK